jgi:hypothetical protein
MAQPEFVPQPAVAQVRAYASPPRDDEGWRADRPGELRKPGQPRGRRKGSQGPDQGYVLKLAHAITDRIRVQPGEDIEDVIAGCVGVALKRASYFGRAPVIHDLLVALQVWGFLDDKPPAALVQLRGTVFPEVRHLHDYMARRRIADMVPDRVLAQTPEQVAEQHRADWKQLLVKG